MELFDTENLRNTPPTRSTEAAVTVLRYMATEKMGVQLDNQGVQHRNVDHSELGACVSGGLACPGVTSSSSLYQFRETQSKLTIRSSVQTDANCKSGGRAR